LYSHANVWYVNENCQKSFPSWKVSFSFILSISLFFQWTLFHRVIDSDFLERSNIKEIFPHSVNENRWPQDWKTLIRNPPQTIAIFWSALTYHDVALHSKFNSEWLKGPKNNIFIYKIVSFIPFHAFLISQSAKLCFQRLFFESWMRERIQI
jgi:hypothetical protein